MDWIRKTFKNLLSLTAGCLVAFVLLEICLQIYNPLPFRTKGDKLVLPTNIKMKFEINDTDKLDRIVIHSKNGLGFQGPDKPEVNFDDYFSLITVGGSTTEDRVQNDGHSWTGVLGGLLGETFKQTWVNNAGFDGHSTFGHQLLLKSIISEHKPDVVLFLIGYNDVGIGDIKIYDQSLYENGLDFSSPYNLFKSTANYSEVMAMGLNFYRVYLASHHKLLHSATKFEEATTMKITDEEIEQEKQKHLAKNIPGFRQRITNLIELSRSFGIEPVFATQPCLNGPGKDPTTGVDLYDIDIYGIHGGLRWELLEIYNQTTRDTAQAHGVFVIDLAKELARDSSFYMDFIHYSKAGSKQVGHLVYSRLCPYVKNKFALQGECLSLTNYANTH